MNIDQIGKTIEETRAFNEKSREIYPLRQVEQLNI